MVVLRVDWDEPAPRGASSRQLPRRINSLQGNVAVLALGPGLALGEQRLERRDEPRPRLVRRDDVVDVAALGRRVGVREARLVVADELLAALLRRGRARDVAPVDDVDRA